MRPHLAGPDTPTLAQYRLLAVPVALFSLLLIPNQRLQAAEGPDCRLLRAKEEAQEHLFLRVRDAIVAVSCLAGAESQFYYGTAVLIDPQGRLLSTRTAVPPGAKEIRLQTRDGVRYAAQVLARDEPTETVLLQVLGESLPTFTALPLGDCRALEVGERVFTAGNPHRTLERDGQVFWSAGTLTGRYVTQSADSSSRYRGPLLETDATVNPGCDGGALCDRTGRLVGILSLCYSSQRLLGAAIPLSVIQKALPLLASGNAAHPPSAAAPSAAQEGLPEPATRALQLAGFRASRALVRIQLHNPPTAGLCDSAPTPCPQPARYNAGQDSSNPAPGSMLRHCTGTLLGEEGDVLTTASSLAGRRGPFLVELQNGLVLPAVSLGRDLGLDVALLRLVKPPGLPLPGLAITQTGRPRQGQFVGLLGAPPEPTAPEAARRSSHTLTTGILSGLDRLGGAAHQTDALVNAGNAGGPVLNIDGDLIGISSQAGRQDGWAPNSGVGFFAPLERILAVLPELESGALFREWPEPFLGIQPAVGADPAAGVRLAEILPETPAWQAGLRGTDVILALGGRSTRNWPELVAILKSHRPGQTLTVQILREGKALEYPVTLQRRQRTRAPETGPQPTALLEEPRAQARASGTGIRRGSP